MEAKCLEGLRYRLGPFFAEDGLALEDIMCCDLLYYEGSGSCSSSPVSYFAC